MTPRQSLFSKADEYGMEIKESNGYYLFYYNKRYIGRSRGVYNALDDISSFARLVNAIEEKK